MTDGVLLARSLRFYWRSHLAVLLGATLGTTILVGALAVGDSVRHSLRSVALARLGEVRLALHAPNRFFQVELTSEVAAELNAPAAPIILLRGTAASEEYRAPRVQVVGVTEAFWRLGRNPALGSGLWAGEGAQCPVPGARREGTGHRLPVPSLRAGHRALGTGHPPPPRAQSPEPPAGLAVNEELARRLKVRVGDEVLLRVEKPGQLSRDAPLSSVEESTVAVRLPVAAIDTEAGFGRFSLEANQIPPATAFVPLAALQRRIGRVGRANGILLGAGADEGPTVSAANAALQRHWKLEDGGLTLRSLADRRQVELRTDRVFLEPEVAAAALSAAPKYPSPASPQGILAYFVNELRLGERATPYSLVAALPSAPAPKRDDEIVLNRWLADDLGARISDRVRITYYVVGAMRRLEERSHHFRVGGIVPIAGAAADRDLMPDFPGLADRQNCRDWDPGIPIDLQRIRDKDEEYWGRYRGTPKAFVTLAAGQQMWSSRFGNLTAVRYPVEPLRGARGSGLAARGSEPELPAVGSRFGRLTRGSAVRRRISSGAASPELRAASAPKALLTELRDHLKPATVGLFFTPVREQALAAAAPTVDFGMLFLGFSLFLIVAALLLTGLLFAFNVEQRAEEVGTLLATGFTPGRVRWLWLREGGIVALAAAVLGAPLGVLYTKAVLAGLATVWRGAVANAALGYHVERGTLLIGALAGFLSAGVSIHLITRKQARVPARELLAAGYTSGESTTPDARRSTLNAQGRASSVERRASLVAAGLTLFALGLIGLGTFGGQRAGSANAGLFFGAGTLLLAGGIAGCSALFSKWRSREGAETLTIASLGVRSAVRRPARSLAAVGLLASGAFLTIAVGANRQDPTADAGRRASGTGGFALYAETTLPVFDDLNSSEGQERFGLDPEGLRGARVLPLRLRPGDEASCLNLNHPRLPRVLGVDPGALGGLRAFTFTRSVGSTGDPWSLLARDEGARVVPAVGDINTVVWSLGRSLGDTVPYVDERGEPLQLRIVGILANSIFQGALLISEAQFIRRFPSQEGYQVFLIDVGLLRSQLAAPGEVLRRSEGPRVGGRIGIRPPPGSSGSEPRAASRELRAASVASTLERGLEDVGLEVTPATERLAAFNVVEHTYLAIFAVLGGLGLLLGSVGLGAVVLRAVLERRGELALLRAVGFRRGTLRWLVFAEHAWLLALGLGVGGIAAVVAVLPALGASSLHSAAAPGKGAIGQIVLTLGGVVISGVLWILAATWLSIRGPLLTALRNE